MPIGAAPFLSGIPSRGRRGEWRHVIRSDRKPLPATHVDRMQNPTGSGCGVRRKPRDDLIADADRNPTVGQLLHEEALRKDAASDDDCSQHGINPLLPGYDPTVS